MKKRFLIGGTVVALLLSISLLLFSVYAAVTQNISVRNRIMFSGSTAEGFKFTLEGKVTGTTNDLDPKLRTTWDFDYETSSSDPAPWNIDEIVFDSEGKTIQEINITYTFTIENKCTGSNNTIRAQIIGPDQIDAGLIKTTYGYLQFGEQSEGTEVIIPKNQVGILQLKLTLAQLEDYSCNAPINFSISVGLPEGV